MRIVKRLFMTFIALFLIVGLVLFVLSKPRPHGTPGPEAERLAQHMSDSVNVSAWQRTGAVRFTFYGHHHLWDRKRNYDLLEWSKLRVLLRISNQSGRAWMNDTELQGDAAKKVLDKAYALWVNDSFWLNPVVKVYDHGVTRSIVHDANETGLLVEYSSGGITPGDGYLWITDGDGNPPTGWRLWVHVIPIGGVYSSWERWVTLPTGAKISTFHKLGPFTIEIKDLAGAATLMELPGITQDPFVALH